MAGISETKDLVKFVVELAEAGALAIEDGKFTLTDVAHFIGAVGAIPAAIAGIGEIPEEIKDLDTAERQELLDFIEAEFDIANDAIEEIAESALAVVINIFDLVKAIMSMRAAMAVEGEGTPG